MLLTGLLVIGIAVLFFFKIEQENASRRTETSLRVERAAAECAAAANMALMTGDPVGKALAACSPGGRAASYHLSANGDVLATAGDVAAARVEPVDAHSLDLSGRGAARIALKSGAAFVAWRPLDNDEAALVAAPAGDLYARSPAWIFCFLVRSAVSGAIASVMHPYPTHVRAPALH
jgi:two-component system cell cycle sensor histidine kinase PleC